LPTGNDPPVALPTADKVSLSAGGSSLPLRPRPAPAGCTCARRDFRLAPDAAPGKPTRSATLSLVGSTLDQITRAGCPPWHGRKRCA